MWQCVDHLEHHVSRKCHSLCIVVFSCKAVASVCGAGWSLFCPPARWVSHYWLRHVLEGQTWHSQRQATFWWGISPPCLNSLISETSWLVSVLSPYHTVVVKLWYNNKPEEPFCKSSQQLQKWKVALLLDTGHHFSGLSFLKSQSTLLH